MGLDKESKERAKEIDIYVERLIDLQIERAGEREKERMERKTDRIK